MKTQTIDAKILFAQNAIANSMDVPEILAAVAVYGYDATKLGEGKALQENTEMLQTKQKKEYGEQYEATDAMRLAKAITNKTYMKHVKLARIGLKDERGLWQSLQLNGRRKESFSGWLDQASAYYANALNTPEVLTAMEKYNITAEKLTANQTLLIDVEKKRNAQLKETGEAQTATKARDKALDAMQDWISDYIEVARIALEEEPQYLEMLDIVVPS